MVTGVVEALGVSMGRSGALMGPGPDNPAGYWEIRALKELDDELLAEVGGAWDRPPVLVPGWETSPSLDPFRVRAAAVLDDSFGPFEHRPPNVGLKDPRLSIVLPFWRTVTAVDATVVVVRDPLEVIRSLEARNGFDRTHSALLWLRYVLAALDHDPAALVVRQQDLFTDLEPTLERLAAHLGLDAIGDTAREQIHRRVDPGLYHHRAEASTASDNPVVALARDVWNDGDIDRSAISGPGAEALAQGWLRSPADDQALTEARARVVELQETVRRRKRKIAGLEDDLRLARAQLEPRPTAIVSVDEATP